MNVYYTSHSVVQSDQQLRHWAMLARISSTCVPNTSGLCRQTTDYTGRWCLLVCVPWLCAKTRLVCFHTACGQPTVWMMYQQGLVTETVLGGWHRGLYCCKLWSLRTANIMMMYQQGLVAETVLGGWHRGLCCRKLCSLWITNIMMMYQHCLVTETVLGGAAGGMELGPVLL